MAREAEADREAKALLISSEAELQVSRKLAEAAVILSKNPQAMQIRFLQTVTAVATEQNSTLVMPIPIELLSLFGGRSADQGNGLPPAPPAVPPPPSSQGSPGPEEGRQPDPGNGRPG
jgi:hypothetical protein